MVVNWSGRLRHSDSRSSFCKTSLPCVSRHAMMERAGCADCTFVHSDTILVPPPRSRALFEAWNERPDPLARFNLTYLVIGERTGDYFYLTGRKYLTMSTGLFLIFIGFLFSVFIFSFCLFNIDLCVTHYCAELLVTLP